jgi:enoyl-CoA hydratase/carnithine racemase
VPEAELSEKTEALARKLADKSPDAIRLGKLSFYKTEDLNYHDAVNLSNFYFATLCTTDSAKEGVYKFLKKE